jgi:DNA-binding beta-propeller fold protein YncE
MADVRALVSEPTANDVQVLDLTTTTLLATVPAVGPGIIAILPNATQAYVIQQGATPGHVYPINIPAFTAGATILCGNVPEDIAASPNGTHVYTVNSIGGGGTVTPIATPSNVPGPDILLGAASNSPRGGAVNPASTMLYVTTPFNGIVPISIPANTVGATFGSAALSFNQPTRIAIMPTGASAYVGSSAGVFPVNLVAQTVGPVIVTTAGSPQQVFLSPDGTQLFCPDGSGSTVVVISTATNTQTHSITVSATHVPNSGGFDATGSTFYTTVGGDGTIVAINTSTYVATTVYSGLTGPADLAIIPTPAPPPTPPFPGGQFIPKLFIPQKGKVNVDYTPDELRANWMAIEIWSQRWLPPPTTALLFPHKNDPTPEGVNANWITLEVWGQVIKNLGAPYTPLFVPRKPSVNPEDLDIAFLATQNWANRLPL